MKKIALCAPDSSLQAYAAEIQYVVDTLSQLQTQIQIYNISQPIFPSLEKYEGLVLFSDEQPQHFAEFSKMILDFYQKSKPIATVGISALHAATVLKKHKPLITLGLNADYDLQCKKLNIQIEHCPSNDYITDRDCKILSTPGKNNPEASPSEIQHGLKLLLKELAEMA